MDLSDHVASPQTVVEESERGEDLPSVEQRSAHTRSRSVRDSMTPRRASAAGCPPGSRPEGAAGQRAPAVIEEATGVADPSRSSLPGVPAQVLDHPPDKRIPVGSPVEPGSRWMSRTRCSSGVSDQRSTNSITRVGGRPRRRHAGRRRGHAPIAGAVNRRHGVEDRLVPSSPHDPDERGPTRRCPPLLVAVRRCGGSPGHRGQRSRLSRLRLLTSASTCRITPPR